MIFLTALHLCRKFLGRNKNNYKVVSHFPVRQWSDLVNFLDKLRCEMEEIGNSKINLSN